MSHLRPNHTENQGALEFNIALSKRRAEAVTAAVASNIGEVGRAKNRRVELVPQ